MLKKTLMVGVAAFLMLSGPLMGTALAADDAVKAAADAAAAAQASGDTGFMLMASALVLLMTPGLAFFYGGFVRSRNVLNTMMMSFMLMGIVGTTWILWGYSFAFAPGSPFFGGFQWILGNIGVDASGYLPHMAYEDALKAADPKYADVVSYAGTIPHQAYMVYQAMFAIITPALISGAIVERISFKAYFWFVTIWSTVIYSIVAHMVWAKGGFLGLYGGMGALDFAGGTVVHISSGVSALVAAWVLGPRKTYPNQPAAPHNVPFILLGAGLLWFGWFGFNGGSALASGTLATVAFVNTNTSTAAAALMWIVLEWVLRGKPTAVGIATGAVAGLVGITPAAGFVTLLGSLLIGAITSTACFFAVSLKAKLQFDDSLDTFPVHGVGGTVGAILTGVFATKAANALGGNGLLFGDKGVLFQGNDPGQLVKQIVAVAITYVLAGVGTYAILKFLALFMDLRVAEEVEYKGLDVNEHGEEGYGEELASGLSISRVES